MIDVAYIPVPDHYFVTKLNFRRNISEISILEIRHYFRPVLCPLSHRVMHLDKTGYVWPCQGCTRFDVTSLHHTVYCPRSVLFGNPYHLMSEEPQDDPHIPMEFGLVYRMFNFSEITTNAETILQSLLQKKTSRIKQSNTSHLVSGSTTTTSTNKSYKLSVTESIHDKICRAINGFEKQLPHLHQNGCTRQPTQQVQQTGPHSGNVNDAYPLLENDLHNNSRPTLPETEESTPTKILPRKRGHPKTSSPSTKAKATTVRVKRTRNARKEKQVELKLDCMNLRVKKRKNYKDEETEDNPKDVIFDISNNDNNNNNEIYNNSDDQIYYEGTRSSVKRDITSKNISKFQVHNVCRAPIPKSSFISKCRENTLPKKSTCISEVEMNRVHAWSQGLFLKRHWTTQKVREFEALMNFLYDVVYEDDINVPAHITWIDNVRKDPDNDTFATRLIFLLMCSKRVKDVSLSTLEKIVNEDQFSLSFVIEMGVDGLKKLISHLGMGNKNTEDVMEMFMFLETFINKHGHFPRTVTELALVRGVGMKIASLVLYFAFGQNEAIAVDSHVVKCATALHWIPSWSKTPESIRLCLQAWVPMHLWPHVNIILASFGQMFLMQHQTLLIKEASGRDVISSALLLPLITLLIKKYHPTNI